MVAGLRNDWTLEEINEIYHLPLLELVHRAATIHRQYQDTGEVQVCTLLSIKTGGCSEDCAYCPQAARYNTGVNVHALMKKDEVLIINLSGRGDKDVNQVAKILGVAL